MTDFVLPDVSSDHILGVARLSASRDATSAGAAINKATVQSALGVSPELARRALIGADQLSFTKSDPSGNHQFVGDGSIRYAKKSDLPLFLKKQLLGYPPFLIFVTQITQEFEPSEAASFTTAVLEIDVPSTAALKVLRSWGVAADLLQIQEGHLRATFEPVKLLDLGFLRRLGQAMDEEAKVRTFVVQELGPDLVADMARKGVSDLPIALADSLVAHERDPRRVGDPTGSMLESYCATLFSSPVQSNSLPDMATKLEQAGLILTSHRNLLVGFAGFRHPASHGPDKKTQKRWDVTPRASLVGNLLGLIALRSIHVWRQAGRQEI